MEKQVFAGLFYLMLVVCSITSKVFASGETRVTQKQSEDLKNWGTRHAKNFGTLLNPPVGTIDKDVRNLEIEIKSIIESLAGDILKNKNIQLIVGIYPDSNPNAFMAKIDSFKISQSPGVPVLYGFNKRRPIYELGMSLGLFRIVQTRDELAFIIAHELNHLLEGHVDGSTERDHQKSWWDSQQREAVVDHLAIKMMLGKFDIKAGLSVMVKMARLYQNDVLGRSAGLKDLVSSHHHEGVRISMLQTLIEYLRRKDDRAQPEPEVELNIQVDPRPARNPLRNRNSYEFMSELVQIFMQKFIWSHKPPLHSELGENDKYDIEQEATIYKKNSKEEAEKLMNQALDQLDQKQLSGQRRGDALLNLIQFFIKRFNGSNRSKQSFISDQLRMRLAMSLVQAAHAGWTAESYFKWVLRSKPSKDFLQDYFSNYFDSLLSPPELQKLFFDLSRVNHEFNFFTRQMIRYSMLDIQGSPTDLSLMIEMALLGRYLKGEAKVNYALKDMFMEEVVLFLKSEPFKDHLKKQLAENNVEIYNIFYMIKRFADGDPELKSRAAKIQEAIDELTPILNETREKLADQLGSAQLDRKKTTAFFETLGLQSSMPMNYSNGGEFSKAVARFADYLINIDYFLYVANHDSQTDLFLKVAADPSLSRSEKIDILRATSALTPPHINWSDDNSDEGLQEKNQLLESIFSSIPVADLLAGFFQDPRGIRNRVDELFYQNNGRAITARGIQYNRQREELLKANPIDKVALEKLDRKISTLEDKHHFLIRGRPVEALDASHLSYLTLLGSNKNVSSRIARESNFQTLKKILTFLKNLHTEVEDLFRESHFEHPSFRAGRGQSLSSDAVLVLLDLFHAHQDAIDTADEWVDIYAKIFKMNETALERRADFKIDFEKRFKQLARQMPVEKVYAFLKNDFLLKTFDVEFVTEIARMQALKMLSKATTIEKKAKVIHKVETDLGMISKYPEFLKAFREQLAKDIQVQPHEVNILFPEQGLKINTKSTENFSMEVRGLSAFVGLSRPQPVAEQVKLIEYLMGRQPRWPKFIDEAVAQVETYGPLGDMLRTARMKLAHADRLQRAFVVNSFLAGPSSVLEKPHDLNALLEHMLSAVSAENRSFAFEMAEALLRSQGNMKSIAAAYILSHKSNSNSPLTEGEMIRSLFEAFGAAGIKLGQYLAFTSELKGFSKHLAELQHSALPISYLEAVRLIQNRIGPHWVTGYTVVGILGTGSVNVAVEYIDQTTQKKESRVISILRADIEAASKEDFRKLNLAVNELIKNDQGKGFSMQRFLHFPGLLKIIQKSVALEFNKKNALDMQNEAYKFYNRTSNGWVVQSIRGHWAVDAAFSMDKAPGISAVNVRESHPKLYEFAMRQLLKAEIDLLFGVGPDGKPKPITLFANPDFHDGQVLIDESKKTITILDFGQALAIDNKEREAGIKLLRLISGIENHANTKNVLNEWIMEHGTTSSTKFTDDEIEKIRSKSDRMDRFIFMLGLLSQKSAEPSLAATHWVLGVNRIVKLGEIVGYPVAAEVFSLILSNKGKLSLENFNRIRKMAEKVIDLPDKWRVFRNSPGTLFYHQCEGLFN